jgi:hypothetical protein
VPVSYHHRKVGRVYDYRNPGYLGAEDGGRKTEDGGRKTEDGGHREKLKVESRKLKSEDRGRRPPGKAETLKAES